MKEENKVIDERYVYKPKKRKLKPFEIINGIIFVIISLIIIVPIWKVLVDSLDAKTAYGLNLLPQTFSLVGYKIIVTTESLTIPCKPY